VKVLEPHLGKAGDYHVDNFVPAAEMVVERYGHAIFQA
jgi:hypothetical protein